MNDSIMNQHSTKQDIEDLRIELTGKLTSKEELKKFATKEDLKKLATKEDLKKLATKEEIKKLATKEELKKLATKKDFKHQQKQIDNLFIEVRRQREQIFLLETKEDADKKFNILLSAIDGIVKKIDDDRIERKAGEYALKRQDKRLENHEKRIKSLEMNLNN